VDQGLLAFVREAQRPEPDKSGEAFRELFSVAGDRRPSLGFIEVT
jgi:hypothetical protein